MKSQEYIPVIPEYKPGDHSLVREFVSCSNRECHLYNPNVNEGGSCFMTAIDALNLYAESAVVCPFMQASVENDIEKDINVRIYLEYRRFLIDRNFELIARFIDTKLSELK